MEAWIRKYTAKPGDLPNEKSYTELRRLVQSFRKGKGILIYGPTGSGKTSSAYALAQELGVELLEVNASDSRNASSIEAILGTATKQASLFFSSKIILVDEIDGLTGREDGGGVQALVKVISESAYPVVLTTTDAFDDKAKPLRKICSLVEFSAIPTEKSASILSSICSKENIRHDDASLQTIARQSQGDLRAAINDLQTASTKGKVDTTLLGEREKTQPIESALTRVFKTTDPAIALGSFDSVQEDLDKIFLWVDENLPKEYLRPQDLAMGFEQLSRADVFKGRIMRWQHYRFYVYCYDLLSAGIALSKDQKYKGALVPKPTSRILKLWIAKQKNLKKQALAEKIAAKTHTSKRRALIDTVPYIEQILNSGIRNEPILKELDIT